MSWSPTGGGWPTPPPREVAWEPSISYVWRIPSEKKDMGLVGFLYILVSEGVVPVPPRVERRPPLLGYHPPRPGNGEAPALEKRVVVHLPRRAGVYGEEA